MRAEDQARRVERAVSLVLRTGVGLSAAVILLGLGLLVAKGIFSNNVRIDAAIPYPRDLAALASGLLALDPASVIMLGLVALIATPIARVAVSILAFALERDWRYVAITAIVLAILVAGLVMGKALG
jgi:uncharacterized membrane protein